MKILVISAWSASSGIFNSTLGKSIQYWLTLNQKIEIDLLTVEVVEQTNLNFPDRVHHIQAVANSHSTLARFTSGLKITIKYVFKNKFDLVWARGVTSGNYAWLVSMLTKKELILESVEPHTDYMIEGGTWKKNGLKAKIQRGLEKNMLKKASAILTVSEAYKKVLADQYGKSRLLMSMACAVNFDEFVFSLDARNRIRTALSISNSNQVGIYVGQFGDIYYAEETINFVRFFLESNSSNFFIILTPNVSKAEELCKAQQIELHRVLIKSVEHSKVQNYLSAADFALCPVRVSPSRKFCSPIKNGEYFANGLPVVISPGIGDDSFLIEQNNWGLVIDFEKLTRQDVLKTSQLSRSRFKSEETRLFRDQEILFWKYDELFERLKS